MTINKIKRAASLEKYTTNENALRILQQGSFFKSFSEARDDETLNKSMTQKSSMMDWLKTSQKRIFEKSVKKGLGSFLMKEFKMSEGERLARSKMKSVQREYELCRNMDTDVTDEIARIKEQQELMLK